MGRADCKLYNNSSLPGGLTPLTPMLFKGQLYFLSVLFLRRAQTHTHSTGAVSLLPLSTRALRRSWVVK